VHCKSLRRKDSIDANLFPSFECFPEHDKEYKWRLGFTIIAAVLTHSPSMLVGVVMMRFRNKNQSEEEAEQDGGSSHEELDNRSEAQLNNSSEAQRDNSSDIQYAKRTVVYKTGGQIATVLLSLTLTGCFYRNIQFPVVRNPQLVLIETELTQPGSMHMRS
jgi:hypothetical protein